VYGCDKYWHETISAGITVYSGPELETRRAAQKRADRAIGKKCQCLCNDYRFNLVLCPDVLSKRRLTAISIS
jgi:hypothetical protein